MSNKIGMFHLYVVSFFEVWANVSFASIQTGSIKSENPIFYQNLPHSSDNGSFWQINTHSQATFNGMAKKISNVVSLIGRVGMQKALRVQWKKRNQADRLPWTLIKKSYLDIWRHFLDLFWEFLECRALLGILSPAVCHHGISKYEPMRL